VVRAAGALRAVAARRGRARGRAAQETRPGVALAGRASGAPPARRLRSGAAPAGHGPLLSGASHLAAYDRFGSMLTAD